MSGVGFGKSVSTSRVRLAVMVRAQDEVGRSAGPKYHNAEMRVFDVFNVGGARGRGMDG